ncbi:MAG: efflux transporter outer membrane subunit [Pseudomonadota bacterium]
MKTRFLLMAPLLLSGCGMFAERPDIGALTESSLPEQPETWRSGDSAGGPVAVGWIATLDDPALLALVEEAQRNNPNLQTAYYAIGQARAIARQARSGLFPAVNYSASASEAGAVSGGSNDSYASGLEVGWEIDVWGRVRAARNAAEYAAFSAEADYRFAQYSLAATVAQTYFALIEARLQVGVAKKSLDALTATSRIVGAQRELGAADAYDDSLAKSNLATAEATLAAAEGSERLIRRALEVLLGRYPADQLAGSDAFPSVPALPATGLPSELLERRPDIIAAGMNVASAFSNVGATRATRLPQFSLSGRLSVGALDIADILDVDNGTWSLAAALLGPLFDAGLRRAQIDEATATQQQAIANYAAVALSAFQEVENSIDQNTIQARRVEALTRAAAAQNRAFELAQLRYEEGETNLLDVLLVQSNTIAADSAVVTAQREQLDEWIALNLALGGSWQ